MDGQNSSGFFLCCFQVLFYLYPFCRWLFLRAYIQCDIMCAGNEKVDDAIDFQVRPADNTYGIPYIILYSVLFLQHPWMSTAHYSGCSGQTTINNNKPASSAFIRSAVFNWTYTTPLFIVHMTHWAAAAADAAFIYTYTVYAPKCALDGWADDPAAEPVACWIKPQKQNKKCASAVQCCCFYLKGGNQRLVNLAS